MNYDELYGRKPNIFVQCDSRAFFPIFAIQLSIQSRHLTQIKCVCEFQQKFLLWTMAKRQFKYMSRSTMWIIPIFFFEYSEIDNQCLSYICLGFELLNINSIQYAQGWSFNLLECMSSWLFVNFLCSQNSNILP